MSRLILLLVAMIFATGQAFAHHSASMFDQSKLVLLEGTVVSFSYLNPHSWIALSASPEGKGEPDRWDVEATAPQALAAIGIVRDTLKPGDRVSVAIRPIRDGRKAGSLVFVKTADGKSYGANPRELAF